MFAVTFTATYQIVDFIVTMLLFALQRAISTFTACNMIKERGTGKVHAVT